MKVSLIGMGPGHPSLLTQAAAEAIAQAALLIGSPRLLEPYRRGGRPCREGVLAGDILQILQEEGPEKAAVLLSGDLGFYSGAKSLLPLLREAGIETACHCGISSLQYFCGRLERPWEGIHAASAHGRSCDPAALVRRHGTVFFLTGEKRGQTPGDLCQQLVEGGCPKAQVWVGSRLSYPDEVIAIGRAEEFARMKFPPLSVVLAEGEPERLPWPYVTPGIPDSGFIRDKVPMTKAEVRAVALSKLRIAPGDTLWDVGAGTGSVAVEMALLLREGQVFAIEGKKEACALIQENARKFGLKNLTLVEGKAPAALEALPPPDGVFIGGSGGNLREILETALKKTPQVRVVVAVSTLETLSQGLAALAELPFGETEVVQLTAARSRELGRYHQMEGQNPVFLLRGEGRGGKG